MIDHDPERRERFLSYGLHAGGLVVLLTGVAIVQWGVLPPLKQQYLASQSEYEQLGRLLEKETEIREGYLQAKADFERLRAKTEQLQSLIPAEAAEGKFLEQVSALAEERDIRIREFRPGTIKRDGEYGSLRIELACEGSYAGICHFLDSLARLPRLARVARMQISQELRPGVYPLRLSLDIYFTNSKPAAAAGDKSRHA